MNTNLTSFKRGGQSYKLILIVNNKIYKLLKDYSMDHGITMSCLVENLIYANLGGEKNGNLEL